MALINVIALQGRFGGHESVHLLQLNVSIDGHEWHQHQVIDGIDSALDVTNRPIKPIKTKSIRLIPITDRRMPVCLRTELFGCYLDDEVIISSVSEKQTDMDFLSNGILNDWTKYSGGESVFNFQWNTPKNITGIDIHLMKRNSRACVYQVQVESSQATELIDVECTDKKGVNKLELSIDQVVSDFNITIKYKSVLFVSEIVWHEADIQKEVKLNEVIVDSSESLMTDYINFGLIILGALLLILISFALAACARSRIKKSRKSSSFREAEWIVPDVTKEAPSYVVASRNDHIVHYVPSHQKYVFNQYGHEYSEIGSVTADSGRGGSTVSTEYAQVQH